MESPGTGWAEWLEQHGPALVLLARQYVLSQHDAEDVVHEAFLAFWRTRGQVEDPAAYVYACVRHASLNWLRSRRRRNQRERVHARPETERWFIPAADPRQEEVQRHLAELPAEQREVLVMKIWGRLTFPQIGHALGVPANTAASRYRYGLDKLRAHLSMEATHE